MSQRVAGCCGQGCCGEILNKLGFAKSKKCQLSREEFERTITFLRSVPLFKTQLGLADLPKLAVALTRIDWEPGNVLVQQGELGRGFFLVQSGEATVVTKDEKGVDHEHATLYPGDYFG